MSGVIQYSPWNPPGPKRESPVTVILRQHRSAYRIRVPEFRPMGGIEVDVMNRIQKRFGDALKADYEKRMEQALTCC